MIQTNDALLPVLEVLASHGTMSRRDVVEAAADHLGLTPENRAEKLSSGSPRYMHRISWAISFLKKAGLVHQPRRGICEITQEGLKVVRLGLEAIDAEWLRSHSANFEGWVQECRARQLNGTPGSGGDARDDDTTDSLPPQEALERAHASLQAELAAELLETLAACSPAFFEDLVVKLLVKMGYGGSFEDAARSVGKSGDGGIDGIIKEDRLGLDAIYVQAKRWQGNVGRPDVQAFVGALTGHRAKKGVFITTSDYSREAREYVKNLEAKVVLIDGRTLADYMIEVGLGVSCVQTYEVKRLDSDFFEE